MSDIDISAEMLSRLRPKYDGPHVSNVIDVLAYALQDSYDAVYFVLSNLDVDTAEGELLDFLGELVGVYRLPLKEDDIVWLQPDDFEDPENHYGLADDTLSVGGYLSADDGTNSKRYPNTYIDDETFRGFIKSKAASFRSIATPEVVYNYLLELGIRARIVRTSERFVEIEPYDYDQLPIWLQYFVLNRGFRPVGISITIKAQTEDREL